METPNSLGPNSLHVLVKHCTEEEFAELIQAMTLAERLDLLNKQNDYGETILHQLAGTRWQDRILWVLASISRVDRLQLLLKTCDSKTVIHLLADNNQLKLIIEILKRIDPSRVLLLLGIKNSSGDTALHSVVKCGDTDHDSVRDMLDLTPLGERLTLLMIQNVSKYTCLHLATKSKDLALIKCLLESIPEKDRLSLLELQTPTGRTVLHLAVDLDNTDLIEAVLSVIPQPAQSVLLEIKTETNRTAFDLAVKNDFIGPVKFLLQNRPRCDSADSTSPSIHRATMHNNPKALKGILEELADERRLSKLMLKNENDRTALHLAVTESNLTSVGCILNSLQQHERLALLKVQDKHGETAAHLAAILKLEEILECLLNSLKLDDRVTLLKIFNANGSTALHQTVLKMSLRCAAVITETVKACPRWTNLLKIRDQNNNTVLQLAQSGKSDENLIKHLLNSTSPVDRLNIINDAIRDKHADTLLNCIEFTHSDAKELATYPTKNGNTFLHLASKMNHYESAKKFLCMLPEEERSKALACYNKSGKTPYKITKSHRLKSLLSWAKQQEGFYYLPTPPTILVMYSTDRRSDAEVERDSLLEVLPEFQLRPNVRKDLTADEMLIEIRKTASSQKDISALIVVVMGHGEKGAVCAKDKPVRIQDMLIAMSDPALEGKPKVLLVQACQVQNNQNSYVQLINHRNMGSGMDPAPGPENIPKPLTITDETRKHISRVVAHFCQNPSRGAVPPLSAAAFAAIIPEEAPPTHKPRVWSAAEKLLSALQGFNLALAEPGQQSELLSSDTDLTHFDLQQEDTIVLIATVNGGEARRGGLIPIFARQLSASLPSDGIYDIFLKTQTEIKSKVPGQILEFRSTLSKKLCLRNIFSVPTSPSLSGLSFFSCVKSRKQKPERSPLQRHSI